MWIPIHWCAFALQPSHCLPRSSPLSRCGTWSRLAGMRWWVAWVAPEEEGRLGGGSPQIADEAQLTSLLDEHLLHPPTPRHLLLHLLPSPIASVTRPHRLSSPVFLLPHLPSLSSLHFHLRECLWFDKVCKWGDEMNVKEFSSWQCLWGWSLLLVKRWRYISHRLQQEWWWEV